MSKTETLPVQAAAAAELLRAIRHEALTDLSDLMRPLAHAEPQRAGASLFHRDLILHPLEKSALQARAER